MRSLIICGFSGIGKTEFEKKHSDAIDIDSATILHDTDFEQVYMNAIKQSIGKYRYILVSTHSELRNMLAVQKLQTVLIYPERGLKHEYLMRYLMRGNSYAYARHMEETWDGRINELEKENRFPVIVLSKGEYLSDCKLDQIY